MKHEINYPIKIHYTETCDCTRIKKRVESQKIDFEQCIPCVLENTAKNKNGPIFTIIICSKEELPYLNNMILENFPKTIKHRNKILEYFKKYDWCEKKSKYIRKILDNNNINISHCFSYKKFDINFCNSGIVFVGNKTILTKISEYFNSNIKDKEFETLHVIQLHKLGKIPNKSFNISMLCKDKDFNNIDKSQYGLIGFSTFEKIYSFPFGKREWFNNTPVSVDQYVLDINQYNNVETSLECAKRELFEEFHIQFSEKIYNNSQLNSMPKFIYDINKGHVLFIIYLDDDTNINYYKNSSTIFLDL